MTTPANSSLPLPPAELPGDGVTLRFVHTTPGDDRRGWAPGYHYAILNNRGVRIGHINLRIGDSTHVTEFAGHIGYEILKPFRGASHAAAACLAIVPLVRQHFDEVIITADPDNYPSIRTIEKIGGIFIDEVPVSAENAPYASGSNRKNRYRWSP